MKSEFLLFCQLFSKMAFFRASVELHSLFPIKIIFFSETSSRLPNLCYNKKGSCRIRLSVGHQLPKLNRRVRLPYPACRKPRNIQHAWNIPGFLLSRYFYYHIIIYLCCPLDVAGISHISGNFFHTGSLCNARTILHLCSIVASASHIVAYQCGFLSFPFDFTICSFFLPN